MRIIAARDQRSLESDEKYCIDKRKEYNIEPGKSFGALPVNMHAEYLSARCYRFFCQPHPRAGKGVFDCKPIAKQDPRVP